MGIDYKGFPYLTFIEKNVRGELQRRQEADSRVRNITAWSKVTSGVYRVGKTSSTTMLGENGKQERIDTTETIDTSLKTLSSILINDDTNPYDLNFNDIYKENRPLPGINGLDISYKSKYGGVRVATIKWSVHTLDQFQTYAPYFLSPGRSMVLEWGWTNDSGIYALTPQEYEDLVENKSKLAWVYFYERALKANGLYDGMLGIVTNYDFSLRDDGGFDCSTEVISQGTLMYGLNLVHQSEIKDATQDDKPQTTIKDFVEYELEDVVNDYINTGLLPNYILKLFPNNKLPEDAKIYADRIGDKIVGRFVTWGFIEDVIVNPFIGVRYDKSSTNKSIGDPLFQLKSIDYDDWVAKETITFRSTKISNHKELRSTNLSTCFIDNESYADTLNFYAPADDQVDETDLDKSFGYLRNIYVNLDVVKAAFLANSDTLVDALVQILNAVNGACVQYWDFNVKVNEADQTIRIIDANYNDQKLKQLLDADSGDTVKDVYLFRLYGGNGIIKSLDVSSNLTNDMTMTALYGLNKPIDDNNIVNNDNDSFISIWNKGLNYRDKFIGALYMSTKDVDFIQKKKEIAEGDEDESDIATNGENASFSKSLKDNMLPRKGRYGQLNNPGQLDDVTAMKLVIYGAADDNPGVENKKSNILIPLTFEMELEGISGIKIGDVFFTDAVPDVYLENSVFQISGVDHSIQNNYWTTTIKALLKVSDHNVKASKIKDRKSNTSREIEPFDTLTTGPINVNESVLRWIKQNMGPLIARVVPGTIFNESLIAGLIYAEARGEIMKYYNAGTADAYTVNSKITNADINIGNQAYTMFQFTSGRVPDYIQTWLEDGDRWKRPNEATEKAVSLLKSKQSYIQNSVSINQDDLVRASIAAYNGGEGRAVKALKNGKPLETITYDPSYLSTIYSAASEYEALV